MDDFGGFERFCAAAYSEPGDDAVSCAANFECPVTKPPTPGFEPPEGYPAEPSLDDSVWYGTDELYFRCTATTACARACGGSIHSQEAPRSRRQDHDLAE